MLENTYTINLIAENGTESILSVKNKTHFKSLATAKKHCDDMLYLINKGRCFNHTVDCFVENMTGDIVYTKAKLCLT